MRVGGINISRAKLIRKIEEKAQRRIQEYTKVSTAFKPEESEMLKQNLKSISKFAEKNNCNIEFAPSLKDKGSPKMNVYERVNKKYDLAYGEYAYMSVPEYRGSVVLPKNYDSDKELMTKIKTEATKILYKNK